MKKLELIVLGESKDPHTEIEIFSEDNDCPHGFDVIITCKEVITPEGKVWTKEGQKRICRNATEYHHLYDAFCKDQPNSLAVESDIQCTGFAPWDIFDKYSKIEVLKSKKLYKEFWEEGD